MYQLRLNGDLSNTPCNIYIEVSNVIYTELEDVITEMKILNEKIIRQLGLDFKLEYEENGFLTNDSYSNIEEVDDIEFQGFDMYSIPLWTYVKVEIR